MSFDFYNFRFVNFQGRNYGYESLLEQTWYAKEYVTDFNKIWVLNDNQLEKLDVSYGADLLTQLEHINDSVTSEDQ